MTEVAAGNTDDKPAVSRPTLAIAVHPNQQSSQTCNDTTHARFAFRRLFTKSPDDMNNDTVSYKTLQHFRLNFQPESLLVEPLLEAIVGFWQFPDASFSGLRRTEY